MIIGLGRLTGAELNIVTCYMGFATQADAKPDAKPTGIDTPFPQYNVGVAIFCSCGGGWPYGTLLTTLCSGEGGLARLCAS